MLYNAHHKGNALSPLIMGLCRVFVYLTAAFSVALVLPASVYLAAAALLCHLIGLTYIAKQEHLDRIGNLWPLGFLAVPVVYGVMLALSAPVTWVPLVLYAAVAAVRAQPVASPRTRRRAACGGHADRRHVAARRCRAGGRWTARAGRARDRRIRC